MTRKLYDPQLTPEREVVKEKEEITKRRENRVTRAGEQYIGTCMLGHHVVTPDAGEVEAFAIKHQNCRPKP